MDRLRPHTLALIVDDEPDICELLEITLSRLQIGSRRAMSLAQAQELLKRYTFDLCLTDLRLPDGDGIALVAHIQKTSPRTLVAVITAHGSMETAIQALKAGAFDFITKPIESAGSGPWSDRPCGSRSAVPRRRPGSSAIPRPCGRSA
jgi:two-component system response regulator PilR (NtrC family)